MSINEKRQATLNALAQIEDEARAMRNSLLNEKNRQPYHLIARLAQIVREQVA